MNFNYLAIGYVWAMALMLRDIRREGITGWTWLIFPVRMFLWPGSMFLWVFVFVMDWYYRRHPFVDEEDPS